MRRLTRGLAGIALVLAVVACGGGGGGGGYATSAGPLAGTSASPAVAAIVNVAAQPAPDGDIINGTILTRLDVVIAGDATVGQVNDALATIGATAVVASQAGTPAITVAVPRQPSADALAALAATLESQPGILAALPGPQALTLRAPPAPANADADFAYLQRARFPAAWNARGAAGDCTSNKVTVIVADDFHRPIDALYRDGFRAEVPGVTDLGAGSARAGFGGFHGYDVLTTLAGAIDATVPTGANPFPDCLDIRAVQLAGRTPYQITAEIEVALATTSGKVVVNASFGWDACGVPDAAGNYPPCTRANLNAPKARDRALWGSIQRHSLARFTDRALVVSAGGGIL